MGVTFKPHFLDEKKNYQNGEVYLFFSKCVQCKNIYRFIFGGSLNPNINTD